MIQGSYQHGARSFVSLKPFADLTILSLVTEVCEGTILVML